MACEIGTLVVTCNSKEDLTVFRDYYNAFMSEISENHEDVSDEDIGKNDYDSMPTDYSFEVDIWGLFEDPTSPPLFDMVKGFILKYPEIAFNLTYEMSWDNSGETYTEEYDYSEHIMRMETVFDPDLSDDFDDDDEDDDDEEDDEDFGEGNDGVEEVIKLFEYTGNDLIEKK